MNKKAGMATSKTIALAKLLSFRIPINPSKLHSTVPVTLERVDGTCVT